jgi:LmbE family N-acetylglucosaminyl deacetylase
MYLHSITTERPSRLLCVIAHPDDEVFCAGETLARWVAAGGEAMVFSATRGEAGQIQDAHAATRQTLGAVREQELRDACALLGVQRVECLDYGDGRLSEVGELRLAREVAARIRDFAPDVVITFGHDGGYGHPDHIAISRATTLACQLIARGGGREPRLYYSVFPPQHRLICHAMAHWLTEIERGARFQGSPAFVRALALLADEATTLQYAEDSVTTEWFPAGFAIVEQGETSGKLYLIVSGQAEVIREGEGGGPHTVQTLGPGHFFGERALARHQPQEASVVATEIVTCLVFAAQAPTAFDGRGADARLGGALASGGRRGESERAHLAEHLQRKIAALAAHHSQFALEATMFPASVFHAVLGDEYFEHVALGSRQEQVQGQALKVPA